MKKSFRLFFTSLAVCALAGCGDAIEIPAETGNNGSGEEAPAEETFSGDVNFTATIANLADGVTQGWQNGETILISDGRSIKTASNTAKDGQTAKFPFSVAEDAKTFFAIYPSEGAGIDNTTLTAFLPVEQNAVENGHESALNLKVAKSSSSLLYFNNLFSMVSFSLNMDGVDRVVLRSAAGEPISGTVTIDHSSSQAVVNSQVDSVVLKGTLEKGKTYEFVTLAIEVSGYSITAYSNNNAIAHFKGGAAKLAAGDKASLPEIQEDRDVYQIKHMYIWGGTGPEYGCSRIYEMLGKPGCFDSTEGRGIEALKDNYLEFHHDGTFINQAGADGKNWWFVFAGVHNPKNKKDVDLSAFYDLLPRHKGTYAKNGAVITFTRSDGTTIAGQWLEPGLYPMPGTKPEISVKLESPTLMFPISGGKDDWTYLSDDYGVMAARPRALFIELEKMELGFLTPEESQTSDEEFQYIPPIDPGSLFDFDNMAGNWNIYGGNSAPFGIKVLGGSGDDPAFISPIDKSWDWDDSIWKESDNVLGIEITEKTDTKISGTCNYWAGNDGQFWNYTWKSTGEDLSKYYGVLHHGKTTFTIDLATMTVTFGNGKTAKFLAPGSHEFVYGKTYEVHDDCFAFAFHLMDPIGATPQRWTDVDRFVNAPLEYVMEFERM